MANYILTGLIAGAASATGLELVSGIVTLFGFFNTSVQGISNVSRIIRSKSDCINIKSILDDELLLELRIQVLKTFIEDLKEIKFYSKSRKIFESVIPKINTCIYDISLQMQDINNKLIYNNSLWILPSWRKYSFNSNEITLRNLSLRLEKLEDMFYKILDSDDKYNEYKKNTNGLYTNIMNEKMEKSSYLSSKIFLQ